MPPWRAIFRSSMLSAPANMPATMVATLPPGLAPLSPLSRTRSATRVCRPPSCARRITGTSPAHDTRFGSSNETRASATPLSQAFHPWIQAEAYMAGEHPGIWDGGPLVACPILEDDLDARVSRGL